MKRFLTLLITIPTIAWAVFNPIGTAPFNLYGLPVMSKGSLVTSDGVANGEFSACADGEILEWDSVETSGVKCVAKPTSGGGTAANYQISANSGAVTTTSLTGVDIPNLSNTITTTGNPVEIYMIHGISGIGPVGFSGSSTGVRIELFRDATLIHTMTFPENSDTTTTGRDDQFPVFLDDVPAGTYTYKYQYSAPGGGTAGVSNMKMVVYELK